MKKRTALKNCFWKVRIHSHFYWTAASNNNTGLNYDSQLQREESKTLKECKQNWKSFAKLNGWKK